MTGCFKQRVIGCNKASVTPFGLGYMDIPCSKRMGDRWSAGGVVVLAVQYNAWGAAATERGVDVTIIGEKT